MTGRTGELHWGHRVGVEDDAGLRDMAVAPVFTVFQQLAASPRGLTEPEAAERSRRCGPNEPFRACDDGFAARVTVALRSPFVFLLACSGVVFVVAGDARGAVTVAVMVVLSVVLRIWQQTRSVRATYGLRKYLTSTVTVRRRADADAQPLDREVFVGDVVPGDVVVLHAGDVVPADLRIVSASDLVVDQSALSGESLPVGKSAAPTNLSSTAHRRVSSTTQGRPPLVDTANLCFSGTAVVAGTATAVVIATGKSTYFSSLARAANIRRPESSFDRGVRGVGWTLIRFMLAMAPIVFVLNGLFSGSWGQAAMFAVAVAVGLTPEMLPVIVTTNLARGATRLARDNLVVRRLDAIQDLGAIEVLCVDKTGTLTEDRIVYAHSVDATGHVDIAVAEFAYLTVHFQDIAFNRLDEAIAEMLAEPHMSVIADAAYAKVDEVGFDYTRRRTTVVLTRQLGEHTLVCKGDVDKVLPRCSRVRMGKDIVVFDDNLRAESTELLRSYRGYGMRVLAIAVRELPARLGRYGDSDEHDLVLVGFVGFVDPIRDSAADAVRLLKEHQVAVKVLTGDNRSVAVQVARQVGVDVEFPVLGKQIDRLHDRKLREVLGRSSVFAELTPGHKTRIVAALRAAGHAVGFVGDGVNDVAALRNADAGLAADTATDVAKQAADLILLDTDLAVIARGIVEGRRTLANTMKYVKVTASSNFGNVLSVLVASVSLPFLPILPIQLLVQNLLYDTAQLTLPWDRVDSCYLRAPQRWRSRGLIGFMVIFGTLSSVFDLATFAILWWGFNVGDQPTLFQTSWFVEGLLTQLMVVLVLRTRTAARRGTRPATAVVAGACVAALIGSVLPVSPLASALHMTAPPLAYWLWLLAVTAAYALAAELVKRRYLRHHQTWL